MKPLKLNNISQKVLPIQDEQGNLLCEFKFRDVTLEEMAEAHGKSDELAKQFENKEINITEFILGAWSRTIENLDKDMAEKLSKLKWQHITQIGEAIRQITAGEYEKDEIDTEKKSESLKK